ncbi:hypothetical protein [Paraburkholderia rhizosphaerae]|uniref:PXPV repeat-containing protein n=1 Tax=Paraburkholderia rhizosphaerae TaxID=480658 RepID=A0A4R8LN08_9BURK|nr:hypothetical protein [Paraburkholderia rhizosphaerae]TDY45131.1 hypothetical protein BX592_11598 [Paraburkholderia rhizosphaerae]
MNPRTSVLLISAAVAAALCGGCAVYPNAPPAYGYGFEDGGYGGYTGYDTYGYGYPPAQSNVYLGFGGYSGPNYRDPYWGRGYRNHGDWNDGRHSGGGGNPHNTQPAPPPPRAGGGGGGGGGGHPPPQANHGGGGGGRAPAGRAVDVSPNNGSRITNH